MKEKPSYTVGGPMFEPASRSGIESVFGKDGAHYNIFRIHSSEAMKVLRESFPEGKADEMNLVLFSTSGVHGTYAKLDEIEVSLRKYGERVFSEDEDEPDDYQAPEITFLVVHPRVVCLRYGNAKVTLEDIPFLRELARTSLEAAAKSQAGNT